MPCENHSCQNSFPQKPSSTIKNMNSTVFFKFSPSFELDSNHLRNVHLGFYFKSIHILIDDGGDYEYIEAAKNSCEEEVDENNNVESSPQLWSHENV